jgi:N-glycosyltransferase
VSQHLLAELSPRLLLPEVERALLELKPDIVVRDCLEFASFMLCHHQHIPHMSLASIPASSVASLTADGGSLYEGLSATVGAGIRDLDSELFRYGHLEFFPKSFYGNDPLPPSTFFCRTLPTATVSSKDDVTWVDGMPNRPTILVALGTVLHAPKILARIKRALDPLDINLLMATGSGSTTRFRVEHGRVLAPRLPLEPLLPTVSLFINHGGSNSVRESLFERVPLLLLPQVGDQRYISDRCNAGGFGRYLDISLSADLIRSSVLEALDDSTMRECARHMGNELRRMPAADSAAAVIERIAANN